MLVIISILHNEKYSSDISKTQQKKGPSNKKQIQASTFSHIIISMTTFTTTLCKPYQRTISLKFLSYTIDISNMKEGVKKIESIKKCIKTK